MTACFVAPIVERDDVETLGGATQRRRVCSVHDLRREKERNHAVRRRQSEGTFEKDDGEIGLMERGTVSATRAAEERITLSAHAFGSLIDAAVAHPRWIADHDIEPAVGHDMREVDVEGKEIELTVLDTLQRAPIVGDATIQLATMAQVRRAHVAEEVTLRDRNLMQLALVAVDRLTEQLGREFLIAGTDQSGQRRPILLRRVSITGDGVGLRAQRVDPVAIHIGAAVA